MGINGDGKKKRGKKKGNANHIFPLPEAEVIEEAGVKTKPSQAWALVA